MSYSLILRSLGARASCPQVGKTIPERRRGSIFVAFLNHENMKKLEIHEIFESRILVAFTEKSRLLSDSLRFLFFSWFSFSFRVFVVQYEAQTIFFFLSRVT